MANEATYLADLAARFSKFTIGAPAIVPGGNGAPAYHVKEVAMSIPDPLSLQTGSVLRVINWRYGVIQPGTGNENVKELMHKKNLAITIWHDVYPGFVDFQNEASVDPPQGQGTTIPAEIGFAIRTWPIHLRVGGKQVKDQFQFIIYKEGDLINETAVPHNEDGASILMRRYESEILANLPIGALDIVGKPVQVRSDFENKTLDFQVYVTTANPNEAEPQTWRIKQNNNGTYSYWKLIEA